MLTGDWGTAADQLDEDDRRFVDITPHVGFAYERAGDVKPVLDGLWLIDDLLPKSGVAAIYGHPGCGKTFLAMEWAAHVASRRSWNDCHVEGGLALYVVAEGQTGFRNRLAAMRQDNRFVGNDPFVFVPSPIDLQSPDGDTAELIETIREAGDREAASPALIVIDTLSKTFGAGKENSDDMATYLANCQRVASAFDCLTLIVHHRPKDSESKDLRGHGSLRGGIDTAILVEGDEVRTATIVKQKDGEEGLRWRFRLDRVVLGINSRGKEVSTCLVRYVATGLMGELDEIAQANADNDAFLACLRERNRQLRAVSEKRGPTFAPTEFAKMPESQRIGSARLEQAMDRLFRIGAIERAELHRNEHRRVVIGLRETGAANAANGLERSPPDRVETAENSGFERAANGAANTVRQTRQTVGKPAENRAANAANTHSSPYGREGEPFSPEEIEPLGLDDPLGDDGDLPPGWIL